MSQQQQQQYTFQAKHENIRTKSLPVVNSNVHMLPFKINQESPAQVAEYFESVIQPPLSSISNDSSDDQKIEQTLKTSLYGRELVGQKVAIPEGISGHLFARNAINFEKTKFSETSSCDFYIWGHDEAPSQSNQLQSTFAYLQALAEIVKEDINE